MKKKKPKERPQPGEASTSREKISAGSKRKLEQVVDHDVEVRIHDDNASQIEKKPKRRKKSDPDSHCAVDAINSVQ
jgi:hypothetical protein